MNFQADDITDAQITNSKGQTIKLGDLVQAKGSKVIRVVRGIRRGEVRGIRQDGKLVSNSAWMNPDGLKVIGSVL